MKILTNSARLTTDQHRALAGHLQQIRKHAWDMVQILNGRARVRYLDQLTRISNGGGAGLQTLRSGLEDDLFREHPDEARTDLYYTDNNQANGD